MNKNNNNESPQQPSACMQAVIAIGCGTLEFIPHEFLDIHRTEIDCFVSSASYRHANDYEVDTLTTLDDRLKGFIIIHHKAKWMKRASKGVQLNKNSTRLPTTAMIQLVLPSQSDYALLIKFARLGMECPSS